MSEAKHTPGEWKAFIRIDAQPNVVFFGSTGWHANIQHHGFRSKKEMDANALLIAAAPDLLAALQALLPYAEDHCDSGPDGFGYKSDEQSKAICNAVVAISKATGE
jgi:hypothetical protein